MSSQLRKLIINSIKEYFNFMKEFNNELKDFREERLNPFSKKRFLRLFNETK